MSTLITYKIVSDEGGKVKKSARTACNFWNKFVEPRKSVVLRLGLFTENSETIAQAFEPHVGPKGLIYGRVEFNTTFLKTFSNDKIAATIVHEIGHTLGFGFDRWMKLFDGDTGRFTPKAVKALPALATMRVETDFGDGTAFSHWDEAGFDKELMTGLEDRSEHVLPVTVDVMALLGHRVKTRLAKKTPLAKLLRQSAVVTFTRKTQAKKLDLDYFRETPLWESLPNNGLVRRRASPRAVAARQPAARNRRP